MLTNLKHVQNLDWNNAQYPPFAEQPGDGLRVDEWISHISKQSKQKEEAFKVVETVLSDEVQKALSRKGRLPIVQNDATRNEFAKEVTHVQGKHLEAAFKSQPSKALPVTPFDAHARNNLM